MTSKINDIIGFLFLWVLILGTVISCKNKSDMSGASQEQAKFFNLLPPSAFDGLQACDAIDIIMYQLPISMNHGEPASIVRSIGFISPVKVPITMTCNAIGRVTYLAQGTILQEAEIHFSPDCQYYRFYTDGKLDAAHIMSDDGVKFFNNIITKVKATLK